MKHPRYSFDELELKKMAAWFKSRWNNRATDVNQATFAKDVLGVSQGAFAQMLNGERPIPVTQFQHLCTNLSISGFDLSVQLTECPEYQRRFCEYLRGTFDTLKWLGVDVKITGSDAAHILVVAELLANQKDRGTQSYPPNGNRD